MKTYRVIRIIKEEFEVIANSEYDASKKIENPHTITVLKEIITPVTYGYNDKSTLNPTTIPSSGE